MDAVRAGRAWQYLVVILDDANVVAQLEAQERIGTVGRNAHVLCHSNKLFVHTV